MVLDALSVASIAAVIGGSMGGMATLEWPLCTPAGYVKNIIPISTSVDHDAWGISWAEAQRQCIFADPAFRDGYYIPTPRTQPTSGLSAARMVGMLTYRSSLSFSSRFGRASADKSNLKRLKTNSCGKPLTGNIVIDEKALRSRCSEEPPRFTAQSYLQYQGQKFVKRFDANCFIHLTRKMDHHDITRGRIGEAGAVDIPRGAALQHVLGSVPNKALVVGIESDVLFTPAQQELLVNALPDATLVMISSPEGHDGFLLEFEILGPLIENHLRKQCPLIYEGPPLKIEDTVKVVKDSVFGEVESGW